MIITKDVMPSHLGPVFSGYWVTFIIQGNLGSMCYANKGLQEHQLVKLMLFRMAFHLCGKVVALHQDNSTSKAYVYNQVDTLYLFL